MSALITPEELRRRREAAGLTQMALAVAAGVSLTSIARAEQGYIPRTSAVVARAIAVLDEMEREGGGA